MFFKNFRLDQTKMNISIRVPATSANLGPGFDLMGLALNIYNHFHFHFHETANFSTLRIDNTKLPFSKKEDLVYFGYQSYYKIFLPTEKIIPYDVKMDLHLPFKGGLGSSASALSAGFALGNFIHKKKFSKKIKTPSLEKILFELAKIEGHPDNSTPAYIGGLIFSYFDKNDLKYFRYKFPSNISMFILIPEIKISTNESRKKLPKEYKTSDVIFNLSRIGTWFEFLNSKKFEDLKLAVEDKIHTPYRMKSVPFLNEIYNLIPKLGAAFSLSGSGPSVLIYIEKKNKKKFFSKLRNSLDNLKTSIDYVLKEVILEENGIKINIKS